MLRKLAVPVLRIPKRLAKSVLNRARAIEQGRRFERGDVIAGPLMETDRLHFLAVGRQGYGTATCKKVADAMERAAAASPTHGVFILGDNFFPVGVRGTTDLQWRMKFEYLYDGPHLRGLPFFAVLGNHDHLGRAQAQVDYTTATTAKHHTGRWQMPARWSTRDLGQADGRPLLRLVFLDTIPMLDDPDEQLAYARDAFAAGGDPVWRVVIGHCAGRSLSQSHTASRALTKWLDEFVAMKVDAFLAADDWFQQIVDYPGEPLSVSTNGGTYKNEKPFKVADPSSEFAASQPGFGTVAVDAKSLTVELRDIDGNVVVRKVRTR